uniref:NADH dehydrogenase subunit 4L n=1 Tax=Pedinomonas minor TaxID=3159 RepID=Q9ZY26_PEDMN|nr:NADH dehydrogenase subunit 4L [Pedinomonas minor]AAD19668.1 NADH dehydrogenase subunit 4L [Pedinomonas minor]
MSLSIFFLLFFFHVLNIYYHRDNILLWLASCELTLLSVLFICAHDSLLWDDFIGILFFLFILVVVGSETGVALAITVLVYRFKSSLNLLEGIVVKG